MALPAMTIAIASFQRRDLLLRLLRALDGQVARDPALADGLDVVVVLDGSTDGSDAAIAAERWRVPVTVKWQPNRGLSAARNAGLAAAGDRIVLFLDDDLVPDDGLLRRHRLAHQGPDAIVVGRCRIPDDVDVPRRLRAWWDEFHAERSRSGTIDRFDLFTAANASGPARLFTSVGGFDERIRAYGLEDYELAHRLLAAGTVVRYDPESVAWHPDHPPTATLVRRQRSIGTNTALMAAMHPELRAVLFPGGSVPRPRRVIRRLRIRDVWLLDALSRAALGLQLALARVSPATSGRAERLARSAAHAAGVAEADPSGVLLARVLGQDRAAPSLRARLRASRQPAPRPASSDTTISR